VEIFHVKSTEITGFIISGQSINQSINQSTYLPTYLPTYPPTHPSINPIYVINICLSYLFIWSI